MSKHQPLSEAEFNQYKVSSHVRNLIINYQKATNSQPGDIRILDFGCGRGRTVLKLRLDGFEAHGVDVDSEPVRNGSALFKKYGIDSDKILSIIEDNCKLPYPDGFFDIVISEQVVEHVKNIEPFFAEIARVTRMGGRSYHAFPYKYHFTEQHLHMPLIHWLPKNELRKMMIHAWVVVGKEPHWKEFEAFEKGEKATRYFMYSSTKTFYRPNGFFKSLLSRYGFDVLLKNRRYKLKLTSLNSYFPHTTQIIATKVR